MNLSCDVPVEENCEPLIKGGNGGDEETCRDSFYGLRTSSGCPHPNERVKLCNNKCLVGSRGILIALCVAQTLSNMNFSITGPIFPPVALKKQMTKTVIGLAMGSFNFIIFLVSPVCGITISHIGAKFMFVSSNFIIAISGISFGFIPYGPGGNIFITLCFLTRILQAVGNSALVTSSNAIIAEKFPNQLATYLALLKTSSGIGLMMGSPLGGWLYQIGSYYLPYLLCGSLQLVICLLSCVVITPINNIQSSQPLSMCSFVWKYKTFSVAAILMSMGIVISFLEVTLANFLAQFDLQPYLVGIIFIIMPSMYALTGPLYGCIVDRKGFMMTMMVSGSVICAVFISLLGPAPFYNLEPKLWLFILANVAIGISLGMIAIPVFPALLSVAIDFGLENNFHTNGMISGLVGATFAFGGFVGGSLGGILDEHIGFQWGTCTIGALVLMNTINLTIYAVIYKKSRNEDIFLTRLQLSQSKIVLEKEIYTS